MEIHNIDTTYDFSKISLVEPVRIQGGAYFAHIRADNAEFYINTPKSYTKNGIVRNGKRPYCDLMYDNVDVNVVNWIIELEKHIKQKLFEKSSYWFQNNMDLDEIDYFFNSPLRSYKTNKYLLRCFVNENKKFAKKNKLQIFDENENICGEKEILDKSILTILHIKGVRFTSNSFHLELELKQIMILDDTPIFSSCLIKRNKAAKSKTEEIHTEEIEQVEKIKDTEINTILNGEETQGTNEEVVTQEAVSLEVVELPEIKEDKDIISNTTDESKDNGTQNVIIKDTTNTLEKTNDENEEEKRSIDENSSAENNDTHEVVSEVMKEIVNEVANQFGIEEQEKEQEQENIEKSNELENEEHLGNIEEVKENRDSLEKDDENKVMDNLEEFSINLENIDNEPFKLKRPNEVFYEIYREARRKAKIAKKAAMIAILEAKNIKNTYMLEDSDDSSDDEFDRETLEDEY